MQVKAGETKMGNLVAQITAIKDLIALALPAIGLLAILLAGALYAFGQMAGTDESRGRMKTWATRVGVGGAIAVIVGVASPAIMTWLQGF